MNVTRPARRLPRSGFVQLATAQSDTGGTRASLRTLPIPARANLCLRYHPMKPLLFLIASFMATSCTRERDTPHAGASQVVATATPSSALSRCTMAHALEDACGECMREHCCDPPVAFDTNVAHALGCKMGCRKSPNPGGPPQPPEVFVQCLPGCDAMWPEPTGIAARVDACLAAQCAKACDHLP